MGSQINFNIQKLGTAYTANEIHFSSRYPGGILQPQMQTSPNRQSFYSSESGSSASLMSDGSLSSSPPRQDSAPAHQNDSDGLLTPLQTPSPVSADGARFTSTSIESDREQEEPQLRMPVAVEESTDYISAGREYDNGADGLNGAPTSDPTAMAELKTPFSEDNTDEGHAYGGAPGLLEDFDAEDTDLKQRARGGQAPSAPLQIQGDGHAVPQHLLELKSTAQNEDADPNLVVDGPEQGSLDRALCTENAAPVPPASSGSNAGPTGKPQSDAAVSQTELDIGDGNGTTQTIHPTENPGDCEQPAGEDDRLSVAAGTKHLEKKHPEQVPVSSKSEVEVTKPGVPSIWLDVKGLQEDGGGGGEPGDPEAVFVYLHRKMLIQDDHRSMSVVEVSPCLTVLEDGQKDGVLPGGSSQLAQLKWFGHRDFVLSQWKVALKPQTSQTADFVRHVCGILLDLDIKCLRKVVEQLNLRHAIYLHSLFWDGGLIIHLGHTNPVVREKCLKAPEKEAIRIILEQLVASCLVDLAWQDPTPLEEEDTEDGRPPDLTASLSQPSSVSSAELFGSGQTTRREVAMNIPHQDPSSEERRSSDSDPGSSSNSTTSFLKQLMGDFVEKWCSLMDEQKSHLESAEKQQLKQQMMNFVECERKKIEQKVQELRQDLEQCQATSRTWSQRQEQSEKSQREMMQLMEEMRLQLQAQNEMITEMKRAAERNEKQWEEREAAEGEMKKHINQVEEGLKVMEESTNKNYESMTEQLKGMQLEAAQQKEHQDELSATVAQHQEIVGRFRTGLPEVGSVIVGAVQGTEEELEGAVGGQMSSRNRYSSALAESEQTTSKMKAKDEEMGPNQIEEKIHPMGATVDSLGLMSEEAGRKTAASLSLVLESSRVPDNPETEPASERRSPTEHLTSGMASAQGGARSKTSQKLPQADASTKGGSSPGSSRGQSSNESSQERTTGSTSSEEPEEVFTKAEQFLEWVQFSSGSRDQKKLMLQHIHAALKEEAVPAPRAKCLDTVLCIDVSDSIVSEGHLEAVRNTAMDFVDGIEDLMNEMDMEENIAVVAMGGNARVVQHLTNDLTLVREAIESLDTSGGRSPFIQALLVCLAANKGRGGIVNVAGVYKVPPRVIFITDGCPTDENQETGPDLPGNINQTKFSLVNLLSQFKSTKRKTIPRPITWVPVGPKADKQFLKSLAELSGGELVMPEDIRSLCRHYKMQQTIGRLLKMVKNQGDNSVTDDRVRELLEAMVADTITDEEKMFVVETVKKLHQLPVEEEEPEADDFHRVFEDEVKVKNGELLALGTRVVRGPDWKWRNQDTDGPGTVILHSKKDNWTYVKWDNGTHNAYRYGEGGKIDIVETQHHPRQIAPDCNKLDFGVRVARGPDWKGGMEDSQGPGTVIRCRESDGKVKVRWDLTGKIHDYHYSSTKGREVQIILPEYRRVHEGNGQNTEQLDADKTIAMWKWRDDRRQWRLYDEATCDKLEAEYKRRPGASCIIIRAGVDRRVSFKLMQEKAVDGGTSTEVSREMVDEERKNDLLAIEMSLQE